jgi:uridylate kinase
MGYVISLGGSSIFTNNKYDNKFIKSLSFLKRYKDIIIVVGGGIKARTAILQANNLNNFEKDLIAINITKENAKFVATNLKYKYNDISCAKDILKLPKAR